MEEIWKAIPGCSRYKASNLGRIFSLYTHKITKGSPNGSGYINLKLIRDDGKKKTVKFHRAILLAFVGPPPVGKNTNHKDGVKANNRLDNLEYVTHKYNVAHAHQVLKISKARGSANGRSSLTEMQAKEIIRLRTEGKTLKVISDQFGCSLTHVSRISSGRNWSHLSR